MPSPKGEKLNIAPKIFIRTMADDLKGLKTQKVVLQMPVTEKSRITKQAPPPKELPISQPSPFISKEQPLKVVEKIIEKPVVKEVIKEVKVPVERVVEKPVFKEKIIEKPVVRVVEKPIIKEVIKEVKVPVEKIVEKPVFKEKIIEKPVNVDKSRQLKQITIILILAIILISISFGGYYLFRIPGQQIVVEPKPIVESEEPTPSPKPMPQTGLLPSIPQIIQTKTDNPLHLPPDLIYKDYNLIIFPDKKLGLVLQITDALATLAEMVFWEKTMAQDLAWLFLDSVPAKTKFKVNNWEYPNIVIRFQDTIDLSQSLHYVLINNKLIITTSQQNMNLVINALLYES